MAINLTHLTQAADRFGNYQQALGRARAYPEAVARERAETSERHRQMFLPAAEWLLNQAAIAPVDVPGAPAPLVVDDLLPEVLLADNDLRPVRFLQLALLAARAVGRVRISAGPVTEEGDATGFLVAPGLLLTNWHVLPSAVTAAAAAVIFNDEEGLDGDPLETQAFRLRPEQLYVSDQALDYALVAVAPRTASGQVLSQFGYLRLYPQTGKLDPTQQQAANIIQHPGGGPKKIALRDNYILEVLPDTIDPQKLDNSLFYGTDTLKGSSGAPVCSDQWYVVALHRGGVPATRLVDGQRVVLRLDGAPATVDDSPFVIRYVTNEGTRISRIYHSLNAKAPADPAAAAALQRLTAVAANPSLGPVAQRTTPILLPGLPPADLGGPEEITRRRGDKFQGARGYRPSFLGSSFRLPLPRLTSEVARELARLKDGAHTVLKYDNYSVLINRERRTAFLAAGNIDGSLLWSRQETGGLPKRPAWSWDPRMDERFQPDDLIFSNSLQRGHLFKREDAVWGRGRDALKRADEHSFTITNATPMIANFNNVEWGDLEDLVTEESRLGHRLSYFAGPIFRSTDPYFNELRANVPAAQRRQGMRVPQSFWKIVAWVEAGRLRAAGFILTQSDEIAAHGPIAEEINFGRYQQAPIRDIEQATGLRFPELVRVDTYRRSR